MEVELYHLLPVNRKYKEQKERNGIHIALEFRGCPERAYRGQACKVSERRRY